MQSWCHQCGYIVSISVIESILELLDIEPMKKVIYYVSICTYGRLLRE